MSIDTLSQRHMLSPQYMVGTSKYYTIQKWGTSGATGLWTDQSFHKTSSFLSISLAPLLHVHGAQTYLRCHPLPETLQWAAYVEGVAKGASCPPKIHAPFHCMEMLDHGCPPRMTFSSSSGTEMGPCGYFSPMEHEWK